MSVILQEQFLKVMNESWDDDYCDEKYSLVGQDGNAFALMGYTARCMRECGLRDEIKEMQNRAMSGDYNNLICVCDEYVQRCNDIACGLDESLNLSDADRDEQASYDYANNLLVGKRISVNGNPGTIDHVTSVSNMYLFADRHPSENIHYVWVNFDDGTESEVSTKKLDTPLSTLIESCGNKKKLKEKFEDHNDPAFLYRMLSRMKQDCDYYLGNGGRHPKHLWADDERKQIDYMNEIWDKLPKKPEWLSKEDIENYAHQMGVLDESLTEAQWNYTLKCGNALRNAIEDGNVEEVINQLWTGYKELLDAEIIDDMDYESYTDDLIGSEYWDEDEFEDNVDWALDNFYDLCDNTRVWIPLMESYEQPMQESLWDLVKGYLEEDLDESIQKEPIKESMWDMIKGYLEEDLHESFNKTEAIKAVQWMYGYSKKRAQQYIKEVSEQRVQSIIDAFKNNAKKSFYND